MGYRVIFSPQSQDDLHDIVKYIARYSPRHALAQGERLIASALKIGNFPRQGRVVPERSQFHVREMIEGNYRIIYQLDDEIEAVFILRFWHAARGTPDLSTG